MFWNKNIAFGGAAILLSAPLNASVSNSLDADLNAARSKLAVFSVTNSPKKADPQEDIASLYNGSAAGYSSPISTTAAAKASTSTSAVAASSSKTPAAASATTSTTKSIFVGKVQPAAPAPEPVPEPAPAPGVIETVVDTIVEVVDTVVDTVTEVVTDIVETVVDAISKPASATGDNNVPPPVPVDDTIATPAPVTPPPVVAEPAPVANPALKQFEVSNSAELLAALQAARTIAGGAEIRLQPGNYGSLVWTKKQYTLGRVYLVPATSQRPVFTHMNLTGSAGMAIAGMQISSAEKVAVYLNSSSDMIFTGNLVTGINRNQDPWDDTNSGMHARWVNRVTVSHNIFEDLRAGTYFQQSSKVNYEFNTLRHIREGLNVAATTDLDISRNFFHSFSPMVAAGEHPDSIQFWTSRETIGSSNVRITENVMLHGGCAAVQGIFIRSETEGRTDIPQIRHQDFTIRGNVYYGASKNGLSVSSVDKALVESNVVIASPYSETGVSRAVAQAENERCSGALRPAILSRNGTETHIYRRNVTAQMGSTDGVVTDTIQVGATVEPFTNVFNARPTGTTPALSAFLTRNPSVAWTRQIGLLNTFEYGASLAARQALSRAEAIHKK